MGGGAVDLAALVGGMADKKRPGRTEADVQSSLKALLLAAPFNLSDHDLADQTVKLEARVGTGRIDVELGFTVFEVKKDLTLGNTHPEAVTQLAGYVKEREATVASRYTGVLTDGEAWYLYHLEGDELTPVSSFRVDSNAPDVNGLVVWLDGVLATASKVKPTPREIERRLGATSSGHALDAADLGALYDEHRNNPTVKLKRELWGRLLTTALGTAFEDSDQLFVDHTLLVLTGECVAHAVIGWHLTDPALTPDDICSGAKFTDAQILNVVEADFFDWPIEVDGGREFVRTLARRLGRFDWTAVEHDVMKVLYESVISAEQRHSLGEYYTPDWLADRIVNEVITDPLDTRALDPSCGSGTFLYHAVRRYLAAAEAAGVPRSDALAGACDHVYGIDVHPVAVALARVTYLLAMGDLSTDRPALSIPVYLGDSVQWRQDDNILTADALTIDTSTSQATLFDAPLRFPRHLLNDPARFDRLVTELANAATKRKKTDRKLPSLTAFFRRYDIADEHQVTLTETFRAMCDLHDTGRDHIWGYFVRNLARPAWFARPENRADALIGNPPWLSYRYMPAQMQADFRKMMTERHMWAGAAVATHQDLSALFVARSSELYLRKGGRFGFVMPFAALSRKQFAGFRTGKVSAAAEMNFLAFDEPWDLHKVKPDIFPVPAGVVFGSRADAATALAEQGKQWSGKVPKHNASWPEAAPRLTAAGAQAATEFEGTSPYADRFAQGATVVPRMMYVIEDAPAGPLGAGPGRRAVQSRKSNNEKPPWKMLPAISGNVEWQFIVPMHLGETTLPFRLNAPFRVVIPMVGGKLLGPDDDRLDDFPGVAAWWRQANELWMANRASDRMTLSDRLDYQRTFSKQFPAPAHRVVYSKAGTRLVAAHLDDPSVVIDHMLYWAPASGPDEARYLCAIFNSNRFTELVQRFQSLGAFGPRHFDKYVFRVPFPLYDPNDMLHQTLVGLAERAEKVSAAAVLPARANFQGQRAFIRAALTTDGVAAELDTAVNELVG